MSGLNKALSVAAITFGADSLVFQAGGEMAAKDAGILAASNFIGETFITPMVQDFVPSFLSHITSGIATGATYTLAQMVKPTSPFGNPFAQFMYGLGVNEITNNLVLPLVGGSDNSMTGSVNNRYLTY